MSKKLKHNAKTQELTNEQKVHIVGMSSEMQNAIKMLIGLFQECDFKEFITYTYICGGHEWTFDFKRSELLIKEPPEFLNK